jgi:hypothetical protein
MHRPCEIVPEFRRSNWTERGSIRPTTATTITQKANWHFTTRIKVRRL